MSGDLLQVPALLGQRLVSFSLTYLVCDGEVNHAKPGVAFHHPLAGTTSKLLGPGRKDLPSIPWLVSGRTRAPNPPGEGAFVPSSFTAGENSQRQPHLPLIP